MNENLRTVLVGEMVASADPDDVLVVYGVGSCVVICLYDPRVKVGGMLHALLPAPPRNDGRTAYPTKFVDQGVPLLVNTLVALGAKPGRLRAQLCGGAQMVTTPGFNDWLNIGQRNVLAAKTALRAAGLKVLAQATGGHRGRTVKLYLANGRVTMRMLGQEERDIV